MIRLFYLVSSIGSANLASFLLFEKRFCRGLIELGYRDGQSHARQVERFFAQEA